MEIWIREGEEKEDSEHGVERLGVRERMLVHTRA